MLIRRNLFKKFSEIKKKGKYTILYDEPPKYNPEDLDMEYMKYPNHISNWNKDSKDYVYSEREEKLLNDKINNHNRDIDEYKLNVEFTQKAYEAIGRLNRDYLKGERGVTRNVYDEVKDYSTPVEGFYELDRNEKKYLEKYSNLNFYVSNSIIHPKKMKLSNIEKWEKELESRPVNSHFHPDKGYKFDVEVPYSEKYDHVADRLGHTEFIQKPFENILRLEDDYHHPGYLDQPFTKTPNANPNEDVDFEVGEVIYENKNVFEFNKMAHMISLYGIGYFLFLKPYNIFCKTNIPTNAMLDGIPGMYKDHFYLANDYLSLGPMMILSTILFAGSPISKMVKNILKPYVIKMQYNKSKDLLFVDRVDMFGRKIEEVFEIDHCEILPSNVKTGSQFLSLLDKDGIIDINCLNTMETFKLFKDDDYWNPELKKEFLSRITKLFNKDIYEENYNEFDISSLYPELSNEKKLK